MNLLNKLFYSLFKQMFDFYHKSSYSEIEKQKLLLGRLCVQNINNVNNINDVEFSVFSQWGDDGIIQYLINKITIENKMFIEFGVEDYTESNSRFLLINNNWSGLVMDSSQKHIESIKKDNIYWKYDLIAKHAFVDCENINDLILKEKISGDIGLLHIDIDGNEYWIWKALTAVSPDIVSIEYNSLFGIDRAITIPYQKKFNRTDAHFTNLYAGASLLALCDLAEEKGYCFIGCNSAGNDAYFIKKEKTGAIPVLSPENGFCLSKMRESRDKNGYLTFVKSNDRLSLIKGLEVYNTRSKAIELL